MQMMAGNSVKVNLTDYNILEQSAAMNYHCSDEDSPFYIHSDDKRQSLHIAIVGGISILIAASVLLTSCVLYVNTGGEIPFDYGIVIDAGSTHTEVFLYRWLGSKDQGTGDVLQINSSRETEGITAARDPTAIVKSLKDVVELIPSSSRVHSPLYVGATAGMRLLKMSQPREAHMILLALKYALEDTNVGVKIINIVDGNDEGMFSWISANFLQKTLHPKPDENPWENTYGALDLGGASTQFAYALDPCSAKNKSEIESIKLYGHAYNIFSKSFLCFGLAEAFIRHQALLIEDFNSTVPVYDPCLPKGNFSTALAENLLNRPCTQCPKFKNWISNDPQRHRKFIFQGGSDFEKCQQRVSYMLNASSCHGEGFNRCVEKFDILHSDTKFLAFSSFYYVASFLNCTNVSLTRFRDNVKRWCNYTWVEINSEYISNFDAHHLIKYCFGAIYAIGLLTEIYGFDEITWKNIAFMRQIQNSNVGWSLGYMINATNAVPEKMPSVPVISSGIFSLLAVFSVCLFVVGIVFMCKFYKNGYHYSRLKHNQIVDS